MATNNLQTDYWVETSDPISNLLTDEWDFELVVPPVVNLKTDQWNFALTIHPVVSLKTDLFVPFFYDFSSNTWLQTILFVGANTDGNVQMMNIGKSDDGVPLYYEVETQEVEFGNRAHLKVISDQVQVLSKFGIDSTLEGKEEDGDYKKIPVDLSRRVNIGDDVNLKGKYFTFKWYGESNETSPVLEGISIEKIVDLGLTNE